MWSCRKYIVLGIAYILYGNIGYAQGLTLQQAFARSLEHNYTKNLDEIEQARMISSQAKVVGAQSAFLPKVTATYQYTKAGENEDGRSLDQDTAKIGLTQNIFNGLQDSFNTKSAKASEEAQILRADFREISIRMGVSESYFNLALAKSEIKVLDEIDRAIQLRYKDISDRIRIGRSRATEKSALDSQIAQFRAQREKAKYDLVIARENFALWTGINGDTELADANEKVRPSLPNQAELIKSVETRKDILAQKKDVESSEYAVKTARAGYFPSVDLFGNYYLIRPAPLDDVNWDAGIAVSIPIFQGGLTRSKVWQAAASRNEQRFAFESALLKAGTEMKIDVLQAQSLYHQASDYEKAVKASEQTYKDMNKEYKLGLVNNLDVLQALNTYLDNYRTRNKVHFQYLTAYWNLQILADQIR